MIHPNPTWHFAKPFHPLNNDALSLVPYQPLDPAVEDRCAFCAVTLKASNSNSTPFLAFTSGTGRWVCQACHCEHKDDFNWPTSE